MLIFTVGMTRLCKQPAGEGWQRCTALCFGKRKAAVSAFALVSQHPSTLKHLGLHVETCWESLWQPGNAVWPQGLQKAYFFPKRAAHQSSPQHRPLHFTIAGWLCQEKQQQPGVKPTCRTQPCNPLIQHPFLPGGQHFS